MEKLWELIKKLEEPGGITLEMLKEVVGEVKIDPAIMKKLILQNVVVDQVN